MTIALSVVSLVVSVSVLWYCIRLTLVYHRFNEQIKDWASSLDDTMYQEINRTARRILTELDERITEEKNKKENTEENG